MSEEDQVRRLLAEARHTAPMPDDVAERLDGVLADLRADRPVRPNVTSLASARRRRRAGALLLAAAAVVVAGVGLDQLRGSGGGDSGSADSAASRTEDAPRVAQSDGAGGGADDQRSAAVPMPTAPVARLSEDTFGQRVAHLQKQELTDQAYDSVQGGSAGSLDGSASCSVGDPGSGRFLAVRYDGAPGLLVFRPVRGDSQVVDLLLCGHDGPVRSVTLPAP